MKQQVKQKFKRILILTSVTLILYILAVFKSSLCFAHTIDGLPPMQKKNKNEVTDFFSKEVTGKAEIEKMLEESRVNSSNSIANKSSISLLPGQDKLDEAAVSLGGLNQSDAERKGYEARNAESELLSRMHVDYKDSQMMQHKQDTDDIARASEKLMDRLFAKLKDLGIDCKQTKGPQNIEPEMHIEIERVVQKEVTYDKQFCEYLRSTYSCRDTLTLTCKTRGIKWGEWQDKQIRIPGGELVSFGRTVFWVEKTGKRCFEYKLTVGARKSGWFGTLAADPYVVNSMREFLTSKHPGSTIDNIATEMNSWWEGGIFCIDGWTYGGRVLGSKDYAWNTYVVNYKYRDGNPACFEWAEDWSERCQLQ